jgi:hypothetical protein
MKSKQPRTTHSSKQVGTRELDLQQLRHASQTEIESLIDCLRFYVPLKNFSLIWRRHPLPVKGYKIEAYARRSGPLSREGSLSCHTWCDTGPRFSRSYPKDRPIQSPLTTHKGMWRIYSYTDPHGFLCIQLDTNGNITTQLYDKRNDFNFSIVNSPCPCSNIPDSPAYGVWND